MLRKALCTVSLLLIGACCVVACKAQVYSAASPSPSVKLTAMQKKENLALDFVLNNLRNHGSFSDFLKQAPISRPIEQKLLFDSKAWPTYQPRHPLIRIGDLSLVAKRREKNTESMDHAFKIITGASQWERAFRELYPECGLWISSCDLTHTNDTLHIHLSFGPSSHGGGADYIVKPEGKTWKIVKRDILYLL